MVRRFNDAICDNYCIQDALDIMNSYMYSNNDVKLYKIYGDKYQFLNISPKRKNLSRMMYNKKNKDENLTKKDIYQYIGYR